MARKHEAIVSTKQIFMVNPKLIKIREGWNYRVDFEGHDELVKSIIENGVQEPISLKKNTETGELFLNNGERRLRAVLEAIEKGNSIMAIPAIIVDNKISDDQLFIQGLISNDSKKPLPYEEAEAFSRLIKWGWKIEDIARKIGRSQNYINDRIGLLNSRQETQEVLKKKEIPASVISNILKKTKGNSEKEKELVNRAKDKTERKKVIEELKPVKEEKESSPAPVTIIKGEDARKLEEEKRAKEELKKNLLNKEAVIQKAEEEIKKLKGTKSIPLKEIKEKLDIDLEELKNSDKGFYQAFVIGRIIAFMDILDKDSSKLESNYYYIFE